MIIDEIETKSLKLIPISMNDELAYKKHFIDYEVIKYLSSAVPWPYPDNGVEYFLQELIMPYQGINRWVWGLHLKNGDSNGLIGAIDLWRDGKPEQRGFWLGRKFWGHGYMSEAVTAVNDYAFNQLGFEELIFSNAVGNERSRRIKERMGARLIKVIDSEFVDSSFSQSEIWVQTKEQWEKFKNESNNNRS